MKNKILYSIIFGVMISIVGYANAQNRPQNLRNRPDRILPEMQKLTPEQEQEALDHVKATYPEEKYQKLLELQGTRDMLYHRLLMRAYREMQYVDQLKERDPEQYEAMQEKEKLAIQTKELVDQYKSTENESQKEELKSQITELLNKIFDIRQQNREKEIQRLEERLAEAKANNEKRLQNKEEIVAERLNELLGEEKWMQW